MFESTWNRCSEIKIIECVIIICALMIKTYKCCSFGFFPSKIHFHELIISVPLHKYSLMMLNVMVLHSNSQCIWFLRTKKISEQNCYQKLPEIHGSDWIYAIFDKLIHIKLLKYYQLVRYFSIFSPCSSRTLVYFSCN